MWEQENYTKWTQVFSKDCYYETERLATGNKIQLLTLRGDGMYSLLKTVVPNELLIFQHLGAIEKFQEMPIDPIWENVEESYQLIKQNNSTLLMVHVDTFESFITGMNSTFPIALKHLKELAEQA
jgi:hypothetical protein